MTPDDEMLLDMIEDVLREDPGAENVLYAWLQSIGLPGHQTLAEMREDRDLAEQAVLLPMNPRVELADAFREGRQAQLPVRPVQEEGPGV